MPRRIGLLLLALSVGCEGADPALIVSLKTDLVPGLQFVGVRTTVRDGSRTAEELDAIETEERVATQGEDYLIGQRVAELAAVPRGLLAVEVALLGLGGEVIAARQTLVEVRANRSITVLLTGSCAGVTCPGSGDDPTFSACVGGRCVDPRCTPESPEFCGTPGCLSAEHCTSPVECAEPRCIDRECFVAADDDRCAPSEECHPTSGCVLRAGVDAGPECPATETSCVDGVDDDCDGAVDCADPDCADQSCDDGSVCTEIDTCQPDGTCGGPAIDCDDDNPCTTDACAPEFGCTHAPNTAPCDDGYWCNGTDTCRDGACQDHADPPCASFCNESAMTCEQCAADADCGAPVVGAWGTCGGFTGGVCDESGTQTRSVMTPRCELGACIVQTTSESQACPRDTENDSCGTTTYSSWSSCGGFGGPCDESGTRTRTRTRRLCRSGSCTNVNNQESGSCTRNRPNGTPCGGFWDVCCSGTCRSLTTNARCGACGVSCSAIGRSCTRDGATGGYSCSGCGTNAECRSILNSAATCYTSGSSRCNCQCPADGVCRGGGCGSNFFCHDCPGHNFCSPHGGSC